MPAPPPMTMPSMRATWGFCREPRVWFMAYSSRKNLRGSPGLSKVQQGSSCLQGARRGRQQRWQAPGACCRQQGRSLDASVSSALHHALDVASSAEGLHVAPVWSSPGAEGTAESQAAARALPPLALIMTQATRGSAAQVRYCLCSVVTWALDGSGGWRRGSRRLQRARTISVLSEFRALGLHPRVG